MGSGLSNASMASLSRLPFINALFKSITKAVKTLIDEFLYPRLGAGQLYEKIAAKVVRSVSQIITGAQVSCELVQMKILQSEQIISGFVVRNDKAYPVIEIGYREHIATIKRWLDQFQNLLPIGRSGMFKYNNQDHAIATGLLGCAYGSRRCKIRSLEGQYRR
jgi:protoporphyrinogen oxidase